MLPPSTHDPFLPVNYRWEWASSLVQQGEPLDVGRDDLWVQQAFHYQQERLECRQPADFQRLAERMPAIHQAHGLSQLDPPFLRWAVEARLLAREPFDAIAQKCGMMPAAIEAFEALFFSVRDKLDADTWVTCRVIGSRLYHMGENDLDVFWKVIGFNFGPVALDTFIHGVVSPAHAENAEQLNQLLAREMDDLLARKKMLAALILPVTQENALQIVRLAEAMKRMAAAAPAPGQAMSASIPAQGADMLAELLAQQPVEQSPAEELDDVGLVEPVVLDDLGADDEVPDSIGDAEPDDLAGVTSWPERAAS